MEKTIFNYFPQWYQIEKPYKYLCIPRNKASEWEASSFQTIFNGGEAHRARKQAVTVTGNWRGVLKALQ